MRNGYAVWNIGGRLGVGTYSFLAVLLLVFSVNAKTIWYCPKCDSENIDIVYLNRPIEENTDRRSIDQGFKPYNVRRTLEMRYETVRMRCNDCGYIVKHVVPDFR
jgi:Zn finger protein HypA/HybF involved in hydrogenase expression